MKGRKDRGRRRGFTVRDLAVGLVCLLVAGSLLVSLTGATRSLTQTQVCADHLRQLFTGMTAYVNQYNSYPPNAPYPNYVTPAIIGQYAGMNFVSGWDPNIGFILTHGLGIEPPARDSATGHFIWYGAAFASLPDVCKCPGMAPGLLDPTNSEVSTPGYKGEGTPVETVFYQYALSYQTSGTCRAACPVIRQRGASPASPQGIGGRQPPIPDPTGGDVDGGPARPYGNASRGTPYVYVYQKMPGKPASSPTETPGQEPQCYIQAVAPSEVDQPGRVYYLSDNRDYRPEAKGSQFDAPPAGFYNGWSIGYGNKVFLGSRHYGYANVMYLDGRVTRDNQEHDVYWNMDYDSATNQGRSTQWRVATFADDIRLANIRGQSHQMPVLCVKGWEYFFDGNGLKAH